MNLQLTTEESVELKDTLDLYLHELEVEIARTDRKELRQALRHRADCLEAIRRHLGVADVEEGAAYA